MTSNEKLDAKIFSLYAECDISPVKSFKPPQARYQTQKDKFLSREIDNPNLDVDIDLNQLDQNQDRIEVIAEKLDDAPQVVQTAYREVVDNALATIELIRLTDKINRANSASSRRQLANQFSQSCLKLYGQPQESLFNTALSCAHQVAANSQKPEAKQLASQLPPQPEADSQVNLPDAKVIAAARQQITETFQDLLAVVPNEQNNYPPQQAAKIFQAGLEVIGADYEAVVITDKGGGSISVNHHDQQVKVPATRAPLTKLELQQLLLHEIGIHVNRSVQAQSSRLQLLQRGLEGYLRFEEGLGMATEQAWANELNLADNKGIMRYLRIGLGLGLDGTPRDFRQVFEIIWRYLYLANLENHETPKQAQKAARNLAYEETYRTFRGSIASEPGAVNTKDIQYLEGNMSVWQLFEEGLDLEYVLQGKFDPTNPKHVEIMETIS